MSVAVKNTMMNMYSLMPLVYVRVSKIFPVIAFEASSKIVKKENVFINYENSFRVLKGPWKLPL